MKKLLLPLCLLLCACADTGPSGPVNFNRLYQGSIGGEPVVVVQAKDFNPADEKHWEHTTEYGEWTVKDVLGLARGASVYIIDSDQLPADQPGIESELKQHTIAVSRWMPEEEEVAFTRDPFNAHENF